MSRKKNKILYWLHNNAGETVGPFKPETKMEDLYKLGVTEIRIHEKGKAPKGKNWFKLEEYENTSKT